MLYVWYFNFKIVKRKFKNILLSLTQEDINKITSYKTLNIL